MKLTKLNTSLLAGLFFSTVASADPMREIFDGMYSYSVPSAGQMGNGRYGVNFGSFSYRPKVTDDAQLLTAKLPRASVGDCGEIDMFAGSFSFIGTDELTQMGRAIMQGAASYAFKVALAAISPLSAQQMEDLQQMLQDMNKFTRNACQFGSKLAQDITGGTAEDTVAKGWFPEWKKDAANEGACTDMYSCFINNPTTPKDAANTAGVSLKANTTFQMLKNANINGFFFSSWGSLQPYELAMTIFGTTTISDLLGGCEAPTGENDGYCPQKVAAKKASYFVDFFINLDDITAPTAEQTISFKYLKCNDIDTCSQVTEQSASADRLYPKIYLSLSKSWDNIRAGKSVDDGNPNGLQIAYLAGNDMAIYMARFGNSVKEQYISQRALRLTNEVMKATANDLVSSMREAMSSLQENTRLKLPGTKELQQNVDNFGKGMAKQIEVLDKRLAVASDRMQSYILLNLKRD